MNDQTPPAPQGNLTLTVSFDIDQDDPQLLYSFVPNGATPSPTDQGGRYAGAIFFPPNEQINLVVQGWGNEATFETFDILDCSFITRPKINKLDGSIVEYAPPSPFDRIGRPIHQLALVFNAPIKTSDGSETCISQELTNPIQIGSAPGRWELSFLLTVTIRRTTVAPEVRVYWFDPEGEVGTGAVMREDDVTGNEKQNSAEQPARA